MAPSEPRSPLVLDATVLSNLAFTADLPLVLETLPVEIVTVPAVVDELRGGVEAGHTFLGSAIEAMEPVAVEGTPEAALRDHLDRGETYALHAAHTRNGTLGTDDRDARELAAARDVPVMGSLGILGQCVLEQALTVEEADERLTAWIEGNDYYSPVESIAAVLPDDAQE